MLKSSVDDWAKQLKEITTKTTMAVRLNILIFYRFQMCTYQLKPIDILKAGGIYTSTDENYPSVYKIGQLVYCILAHNVHMLFLTTIKKTI